MQKPRLLNINNRIQLCYITYSEGNITDIHGPIQCMGDPGVSSANFVQKLIELIQEAYQTSKVLELQDLPEHIQKEIKSQIESSSSSESSESE